MKIEIFNFDLKRIPVQTYNEVYTLLQKPGVMDRVEGKSNGWVDNQHKPLSNLIIWNLQLNYTEKISTALFYGKCRQKKEDGLQID